MKVSNKRKRGKASGMNSNFTSTGRRQEIREQTNSIHRRREREFCREVVKAYRAESNLPDPLPPTVGGFYAT